MSAPSPAPNQRATELAAGWLERRPELRRLLERVARQDGEEKIRRLASSALSGANKPKAAQLAP